MKNQELTKQYNDIVKLIDQAKLFTDSNLELQGHLGKYICILVAGFLENAISAVYIDFVSGAASKPVAQYTINVLDKIQNPKATKFLEIAGQFKEEWRKELENFFDEDRQRRPAIDSIMTQRHLIAHGKNSDISLLAVKKYLEKSIEVIEFIENQCNAKKDV